MNYANHLRQREAKRREVARNAESAQLPELRTTNYLDKGLIDVVIVSMTDESFVVREAGGTQLRFDPRGIGSFRKAMISFMKVQEARGNPCTDPLDFVGAHLYARLVGTAQLKRWEWTITKG